MPDNTSSSSASLPAGDSLRASASPAKPGMLTLDEALARLLTAVTPLPAAQSERLSTFDALGRVLAEDVRSTLDVPPEDNTSMDGYALRSADVPIAGTVLPVSQRIPAGVVGAPLQAGTAARIFTGAQVPRGADAVVMQEQCEPVADDIGTSAAGAASTNAGTSAGSDAAPHPGKSAGTSAATSFGAVRVNVVPEPGQWVRRRGEDVQIGAVVLTAGTRLTPQALGLAAAVGAAELAVARRPRVALFSTGDELAMPGEPLKPGAIYNSNRFTLRGLIVSLGCECIDLGIVPDRLDATRDALRRAAAVSDLIVTCGGVSVGEEDHLRPAVQAEGHIDMWQIAIKPGKPLAFGEVRRGDGSEAYFIGLPGNPVSAYVTFLLAVRPVLLQLQGATDLALKHIAMRADFDWPRADRRREFLRVRRNDRGGLDLFANQSSGVLTSVVWGDGVIDNPPGQAIRAGDPVRYLPFAELLQ